MSDNGDWYCQNCGYLSATRVTYFETCDECHIPVEWHEADTRTEVERLTLKLDAEQKRSAAWQERFESACRRSDESFTNSLTYIKERDEALLRLDALRRIVSDWRACPGSDSEYGIETAFNQLVETLERDVENQRPCTSCGYDAPHHAPDCYFVVSTAEEERGPAYPTADAYEAACAALERHRRRADVAEARLRNVIGWRENDWPEGFCRRTAEMVAELASPSAETVEARVSEERGRRADLRSL